MKPTRRRRHVHAHQGNDVVRRVLRRLGGGPLYTATKRRVFGRDVVAGAAEAAQAVGLPVAPLDPERPPTGLRDLLSAGVYKDDVATVHAARTLPNPPRHVFSVAAGVEQFAQDACDTEGVYGVGQWAPGAVQLVNAGMDEAAFLAAWDACYGGAPDYPAVQAYAAGVIAQAAMAAAPDDPVAGRSSARHHDCVRAVRHRRRHRRADQERGRAYPMAGRPGRGALSAWTRPPRPRQATASHMPLRSDNVAVAGSSGEGSLCDESSLMP
ncbi:hypothetical protein ABH935_010048 [Catenulispora sp. GAS73]